LRSRIVEPADKNTQKRRPQSMGDPVGTW
jgi:hypothetical protein